MPKSRSLRETISQDVDAAVDAVKGAYNSVTGTFQRARARDAARAAAQKQAAQAPAPAAKKPAKPNPVTDRQKYIDSQVDGQ